MVDSVWFWLIIFFPMKHRIRFNFKRCSHQSTLEHIEPYWSCLVDQKFGTRWTSMTSRKSQMPRSTGLLALRTYRMGSNPPGLNTWPAAEENWREQLKYVLICAYVIQYKIIQIYSVYKPSVCQHVSVQDERNTFKSNQYVCSYLFHSCCVRHAYWEAPSQFHASPRCLLNLLTEGLLWVRAIAGCCFQSSWKSDQELLPQILGEKNQTNILQIFLHRFKHVQDPKNLSGSRQARPSGILWASLGSPDP